MTHTLVLKSAPHLEDLLCFPQWDLLYPLGVHHIVPLWQVDSEANNLNYQKQEIMWTWVLSTFWFWILLCTPDPPSTLLKAREKLNLDISGPWQSSFTWECPRMLRILNPVMCLYGFLMVQPLKARWPVHIYISSIAYDAKYGVSYIELL